MKDENLTLDQAICIEVRAELARQKISVARLGKLVPNIGINSLYKKTSGETAFTNQELLWVCRALQLSLPALLTDARKLIRRDNSRVEVA